MGDWFGRWRWVISVQGCIKVRVVQRIGMAEMKWGTSWRVVSIFIPWQRVTSVRRAKRLWSNERGSVEPGSFINTHSRVGTRSATSRPRSRRRPSIEADRCTVGCFSGFDCSARQRLASPARRQVRMAAVWRCPNQCIDRDGALHTPAIAVVVAGQ